MPLANTWTSHFAEFDGENSHLFSLDDPAASAVPLTDYFCSFLFAPITDHSLNERVIFHRGILK